MNQINATKFCKYSSFPYSSNKYSEKILKIKPKNKET